MSRVRRKIVLILEVEADARENLPTENEVREVVLEQKAGIAAGDWELVNVSISSDTQLQIGIGIISSPTCSSAAWNNLQNLNFPLDFLSGMVYTLREPEVEISLTMTDAD